MNRFKVMYGYDGTMVARLRNGNVNSFHVGMDGWDYLDGGSSLVS